MLNIKIDMMAIQKKKKKEEVTFHPGKDIFHRFQPLAEIHWHDIMKSG